MWGRFPSTTFHISWHPGGRGRPWAEAWRLAGSRRGQRAVWQECREQGWPRGDREGGAHSGGWRPPGSNARTAGHLDGLKDGSGCIIKARIVFVPDRWIRNSCKTLLSHSPAGWLGPRGEIWLAAGWSPGYEKALIIGGYQMGKSNSLGPLQPLASQPPQTQAQGRGQGGDTGRGGLLARPHPHSTPSAGESAATSPGSRTARAEDVRAYTQMHSSSWDASTNTCTLAYYHTHTRACTSWGTRRTGPRP